MLNNTAMETACPSQQGWYTNKQKNAREHKTSKETDSNQSPNTTQGSMQQKQRDVLSSHGSRGLGPKTRMHTGTFCAS
jgi:hypothetical protein